LKYISKAFFSALFAFVLLFPWQMFFSKTLCGAIYIHSELFNENFFNTSSSISAVQLYLRFVGYWIIAIFFVIRSQIYSNKWTQTLLGRIEHII
jgi:hypothetical protein